MEGFRKDFLLDIVELTQNGLQQVGTWHPTKGVKIIRSYVPFDEPKLSSVEGTWFNNNFKIITCMVCVTLLEVNSIATTRP